MRKKILSIVIVFMLVGGGVLAWWLLNKKEPETQKEEPAKQQQVPQPVTTFGGKCVLEEGAPTYVYEITESASVDGTYQIFDDTNGGERGFLVGGESLPWTTQDSEIEVTINDGQREIITAAPCDEGDSAFEAGLQGARRA